MTARKGAKQSKPDLTEVNSKEGKEARENSGHLLSHYGSSSLKELRRSRLEARLEELNALIRCRKLMSAEELGTKSALECAQASLQAATTACKNGKVQVGWAQCHQAYRFLLACLNDKERKVHSIVLRHEAEEKLKNWRKPAVIDVLTSAPASNATESPTCEELILARCLLDEHFENMYFKLEALALRVQKLPMILTGMIFVILAATLTSQLVVTLTSQVERSTDLFYDFQRIVLVMLAGAIGALLSNTMSVLEVGSRIPVFLSERARWLVFPLLGAISAVAVVMVLETGLLPIKFSPDSPLFGWALVGGFSDQLLKRALNRVEKAAEK